ncbi:MAG: MFS transporter [Ilumatobacteraceae bacterium]
MPAPKRTRSELSVVVYLAFLGVLMAFGIDVSLPAFDELRAEFDLDARGVSVGIVGTLYILGTATGQLVYGAASDRFGRRNVMLVGISLYALGALGAAMAPTLEVLLLSRLVWGLGAAAPYVLRLAIVRDLYEGDRMARVVTIVMAVFLIGPIFVPLVGEAILVVGTWQTVFMAALLLAVAAFGWTIGFGETLDPAARQPFDLGAFGRATRAVVSNRVTIGHIIAMTLLAVPFFVYLGSAQPIIDQIYGRPEQFALLFAASGVLMAATLLVNNRLIARFGTARMVMLSAVALAVVGVVGLVLVVATDGVPSIWLWFGWAAISNSLSVILAPMCSALALEPMGEIAGTASALLGFISLAGGALLAAIVDAMIEDTVTPMVLAYALYGLAALAVLRWARPGQHPATSPAPEPATYPAH